MVKKNATKQEVNNMFINRKPSSYNNVKKEDYRIGQSFSIIQESIPAPAPNPTVSDMTCGILTKNDKGFVMAFDTWGSNPENNHFIHKIAYNKQNKVAIGESGDNGVYTSHGLVKIHDIMQDFCDNFDVFDSDKSIEKLLFTTEQFVDEIIVNADYRVAMVQYILIFHDMRSGRNMFGYREISKAYSEQSPRVPGYFNDWLTKFYSNDFFSLGVNMDQDNEAYGNLRFIGMSLNDLQKFTEDKVQHYIGQLPRP